MSGRLPDFLGIGAQKAGTTWLFEMLRDHPGLAFPAGKEVHFWDWYQDRGLDWYRSQFADAAPGTRIGDVTPGYAVLPAEAVAQVHRAMPDGRLLFIARNPIERAWSAALMALRWALMYEHEASDAWFLDVFRSGQSLGRGDYAQCMETWLSAFPRERLLVLFYDDLVADPTGVLAAACRHLDVDPAPVLGIAGERLGRRVNAGEGTPLRPSLLGPLRDLYASRIAAFQRLTGRDLSHWLA
ncbi:sulfotransferase domain-containing protein [Stella humosa]|uniref:Sulfotransferase domain-containing protein n=1 Tax=Stella humosa TaxID=94 RepID=A0A3N1KUA4_9PROT|nr:sulfotransferase [Stella humosa]ROP83052.1 sulfotransferase domain-containing protein [Stella humosa]BBK30175.1 deacetylase sulfotransferase [Stella humosa]